MLLDTAVVLFKKKVQQITYMSQHYLTPENKLFYVVPIHRILK